LGEATDSVVEGVEETDQSINKPSMAVEEKTAFQDAVSLVAKLG